MPVGRLPGCVFGRSQAITRQDALVQPLEFLNDQRLHAGLVMPVTRRSTTAGLSLGCLSGYRGTNVLAEARYRFDDVARAERLDQDSMDAVGPENVEHARIA